MVASLMGLRVDVVVSRGAAYVVIVGDVVVAVVVVVVVVVVEMFVIFVVGIASIEVLLLL